MGVKNLSTTKQTPLKAIRHHCIDCSGGSTKDVRNCIITDCPLYIYRMGTNPRRKGIGNSHPYLLKELAIDDNDQSYNNI